MNTTRQQGLGWVRRTMAAIAASATIGAIGLVAGGQTAAYAAVFGTVAYDQPGVVTWTVPPNVTAAEFSLSGAQGGWFNSMPGGLSGTVDAVLPVVPGDTYTLVVGAAGQSALPTSEATAGGLGGFGGGGNGGTCGSPVDGGCYPGAGGGGESSVYHGNTALLVAGGGGGAAVLGAGGPGGGQVGGSGSSQVGAAATGGTQTLPGGPGLDYVYGSGTTDGATPGFGYNGGNGGHAPATGIGGGGAGGGWFGGGGGTVDSGAGGSDHIDASATLLREQQGSGVTGNGRIQIQYGTPDRPTWGQPAPPTVTAGQSYTFTFPDAAWPRPLFTLANGALPAGLNLSPDGTISGTTAAVGNFYIQVAATNLAGSVTLEVVLTVQPAPVAPTFAAANPPVGGVGATYSYRFAATGVPAPVVTLASGQLPPGLQVAPDGTVSGIPTVAGTFRFTLWADNGVSPTAVLSATVRVAPLPTLKVRDRRALEGNNRKSFAFAVSLNRASTVPVTVNWATWNGTAVAGQDYQYGSGTLTFAPGTTKLTLAIVVLGDRIAEPDETFTVVLTSPTAATIAKPVGLGTIVNDD